MVRINKYIASTGMCSRRNAEQYIKEGRVKINGEVVTNLSTCVNEEDIVLVNDKKIIKETENVYVMLNKPVGYITTSKEQFGRPSVLDLVETKYRLFPIGRLDMDSEGLLLLTNDGEFANDIIHPTKHISKTYEVKLKNEIDDVSILKLEHGIDIGGYITRKAIVKKISKDIIDITIYEGKNRQIRRMVEAIGNKVVSLKRIMIGKLSVGKLKPGEYVYLSKENLDKIYK